MRVGDYDGFQASFGVDLRTLSCCSSLFNGKIMPTDSIVDSSRREIMSHSIFPSSVSSKKHRWPIANFWTDLASCFLTSYYKVTHLRFCPNRPYAGIDRILLPYVLVGLLELIQCSP